MHYISLVTIINQCNVMTVWPVSSTQPKTVCTFEVLDHFLIDSLKYKTSTKSFFEKLTRLTNNTFPDTIPVSCMVCTSYDTIYRYKVIRKV